MGIFFCRKSDGDFDLNSFKVILFALSNAKLPEKHRCKSRSIFSTVREIYRLFSGFFRQIASPNIIISQAKLTELFEILLKVSHQQKIQQNF